LHEAETLNRYALQKLRARFPVWKIEANTEFGSPSRKILEKSAEFKPDLIVIGAQGKNYVNHHYLGSVSAKILAGAKCSVRIARERASNEHHSGLRLITGFNGSPVAKAVIDMIAARKWQQHCEVQMVTAIDPMVPESIGRFMTPEVIWVDEAEQSERRWIEKIAEESLLKLKNLRFKADLSVRDENPKKLLIEEAKKWGADCILIGACSEATDNYFSVCSLSMAVAERADCSVEIVRTI
jgi:nucleotide-binding universal stress UspA family protein